MTIRAALVGTIALLLSAAPNHSACADDLGKAPDKLAFPATAAHDWGGWYAGVHVGMIRGSSAWAANGTTAASPLLTGSFDLPLQFDFMAGTGSYLAGMQAGYNWMLPSRWVLGVEADVSFPNSDVVVPYSVRGSQTVFGPAIGNANFGEAVIQHGTLRGRMGYAFDELLVYGTGGIAWTYDEVSRTQLSGLAVGGSAVPSTVETARLLRLGWAAGIGIEMRVTNEWTARVEYLSTGFARSAALFPAGAQTFDSSLAMQSIRVGLNYRIGDNSRVADYLTKGPNALETDNFAFHAQFTYVNQYAPPFRAPYSGKNSLAPNIGRETADVTLYAGMRLWEGAEAWVNPEIDQGFGLSGSVGAAGFPSGEAYKVGATYPYTRLHRAFVRQTVDLGGDVQKVDGGLNQFSGSQTADRLVFTIGKFSVGDIFDTNKYAHDPRADFMNWTIIDTGTFDYAADAWAYTVGAAAEWYAGRWTVRGGVFDMSTAPNATTLDSKFGQFQVVGEIERRYSIFDQPGKVAVTGFVSRGRMGTYQDAIQQAAVQGGPADIASVRQYRSRTGIGVNVEQQLARDVGLFLRAGVADGTIEPYEFTDVDRSIAGGLSISGRLWGRDSDTIGVAGALNGISKVHQSFLNAGGLGILVGDGTLPNPGTEKILEIYYSFPFLWAKATLDYQIIANPGYNRDRGPISVLGLRLRTQY